MKLLDRFILKLGSAVEQAVAYKYYQIYDGAPPSIKWGLSDLREQSHINKRQSNLNWVWDVRNEVAHLGVDLEPNESQKALEIGKIIVEGCLKEKILY